MKTEVHRDRVQVAVIGAGPAGVLAATLLHRQGISVRVLEKNHFPRFSIGESLLPQSMVYLEEAGLIGGLQDKAQELGFQFKNGAGFRHQGRYVDFDFTDKVSPGPGTTFQVKRAAFDKLLADQAQEQGVDIRFGHGIDTVTTDEQQALLTGTDNEGNAYQVAADFVLDASGFARVLPRLFDLESPSGLAPRQSFFTHVRDHIAPADFDRNKILISVHPQHHDVWYWLIPFSDGTCSLGVVGEVAYFEERGLDNETMLRTLVAEESGLKALLSQAQYLNPVNSLKGYSAKVKQLWGQRYALLGNAGEFLDPVFSSGVTIAFTSASLAAKALVRQFKGDVVDWQADYAQPLQQGVDVFRTYVQGWYDGIFQDVIFYPNPQAQIKRMVCSILAGYAWDRSNPYVAESKRRLAALAEVCRLN